MQVESAVVSCVVCRVSFGSLLDGLFWGGGRGCDNSCRNSLVLAVTNLINFKG